MKMWGAAIACISGMMFIYSGAFLSLTVTCRLGIPISNDAAWIAGALAAAAVLTRRIK